MNHLLPSVDYFKKASKTLLRRAQSSDPHAVREIKEFYEDVANASLMNAQHVVARKHGFKTWKELLDSSPIEQKLAITMERHPLLNDYGAIAATESRLSKEERMEMFRKHRGTLRESSAMVDRTFTWLLKNVAPIKTINRSRTSYGLKHIAENDIGYITNGVFIAAAIIAGYPYFMDNHPNVCFGMSKKSLSIIDQRQRMKRGRPI